MPVPNFSSVTIIYNPHSTGPSKRLALAMRASLRTILAPNTPVHASPTQRQGHAEELAYTQAAATQRPLIIASGGDGSYHEVVNGAMRAMTEGATPVCGLLPGGNANDHYRALHTKPIDAALRHDRPRKIDILQVELRHNDTIRTRYAHSYCGFGLTAEAGSELNKNKLTRLKESLLIIRTFRRMRPVKVLIRGQHRAYSSLVCSNIGRMSKILKLSSQAQLHDGNFELTTVRGPSKWRLLRVLVLASTAGFPEVKHKQHFSFTTIKPMRLQLDGEIYELESHTKVTVTIAEQSLSCYV